MCLTNIAMYVNQLYISQTGSSWERKMPFVLLLGGGELQIILKHTSLLVCTKNFIQPLVVTLPLDHQHYHHRLMHIISTLYHSTLHGGSVLRFRCLKLSAHVIISAHYSHILGRSNIITCFALSSSSSSS